MHRYHLWCAEFEWEPDQILSVIDDVQCSERDRIMERGRAGLKPYATFLAKGDDCRRTRYVIGRPDVTSKFTELAIDCVDPHELARFWCAVLEYEVQDEDGDVVTIGLPALPGDEVHRGPVPPTLTFARVPEGKTIKNRLHVDVNPTDREQAEEARRLLDIGARHADIGQTDDDSWICLADPEGNEFCVLATRRP